jgi:hypothetical protein
MVIYMALIIYTTVRGSETEQRKCGRTLASLARWGERAGPCALPRPEVHDKQHSKGIGERRKLEDLRSGRHSSHDLGKGLCAMSDLEYCHLFSDCKSKLLCPGLQSGVKAHRNVDERMSFRPNRKYIASLFVSDKSMQSPVAVYSQVRAQGQMGTVGKARDRPKAFPRIWTRLEKRGIPRVDSVARPLLTAFFAI